MGVSNLKYPDGIKHVIHLQIINDEGTKHSQKVWKLFGWLPSFRDSSGICHRVKQCLFS